MPKLGTTRFNALTWLENERWRERNGHLGCIYGTPMKIKDDIFTGDLIFVLEMKNEENNVGGIGMIKNLVSLDKPYSIYSDGNYNRYIYKSKYRIKREDLTADEERIMLIIDRLLFKGARHYKRGQGITILPDYIAKSKTFDFIDFFKKMFLNKFKINY
jgi:hypothetical protein